MHRWMSQISFALVFGSSSLYAAVPPLVDKVSLSSRAWGRFEGWVRESLSGHEPYGFHARDAALASRLSGNSLYCQLAVSMVEKQVGKAEKAMKQRERPKISSDSYLHAGPMLSGLAVTLDWCGKYLQLDQKIRWSAYANQTLVNIWDPAGAQWGEEIFPWSGWSINNPGNNYYYSFLEATEYWALASGSERWMKLLREEKWPQVNAYFENYRGGGSREGTAYGLSHRWLFESYRTWLRAGQASLPAIDRLARESIEYWIHATVPTMDMVAAIGDQARVSMPVIFDYHRSLMLLAMSLVPDGLETRHAAWWLRNISLKKASHGPDFRYDLLHVGKGEKPEQLWYYSPGAGHLFMRTAWDRKALWLSLVVGIYDEDHAHQNQGAFSLYQDGWLAVTENVFTHSGIQQGTEIHNMLRFDTPDGTISQSHSNNSVKMEEKDGHLTVSADLSAAYAKTPLVSSWRRHLDFHWEKVDVLDEFAADKSVKVVWQINTPKEPHRKGKDIVAGLLCIRPLEPAAPEVSIVRWSDVRRENEIFRDGWKVELSGASGHYRIRLFPDGCKSES